jgi:hypothetical protein
MASVLVLLMGGEAARSREIESLRDAGHAVRVLEPRHPENAAELEAAQPALVVVDAVKAPSHGRATAAWLSTRPGMRTVPFLFLDVPDKDVARLKKELPRAQLATWASLAGAAERLIKK